MLTNFDLFQMNCQKIKKNWVSGEGRGGDVYTFPSSIVLARSAPIHYRGRYLCHHGVNDLAPIADDHIARDRFDQIVILDRCVYDVLRTGSADDDDDGNDDTCVCVCVCRLPGKIAYRKSNK